jgi:hypothetical protein
MDLCHLGAVGKRFAVSGNAVQIGLDRHWICEDGGKMVSVLTDGDELPGFVSSEFGEREATWHFQTVFVLRRPRRTSQTGEQVPTPTMTFPCFILFGLLLD